MIIQIIIYWLLINALVDYVQMKITLNTIRKSVFKTPASVDWLGYVIKNDNAKWIVALAKYEYRFAQLRESIEAIKSTVRGGNRQ